MRKIIKRHLIGLISESTLLFFKTGLICWGLRGTRFEVTFSEGLLFCAIWIILNIEFKD